MKNRNKTAVILASALLLAALWGGAALAAGGEQSDPLVTLSYLNTSAIPQIIAKVEESAANRQAELAKLFEGQVAQYRKDAAAGGAGSSGSASYVLVSLAKGQALVPEVGCELLLRVGTMTVSAPEAPALIDVTGGGSLNTGASLEKNHLYMATIAGRTVQATADTVKVLVRGSYTVA